MIIKIYNLANEGKAPKECCGNTTKLEFIAEDERIAAAVNEQLKLHPYDGRRNVPYASR